MGRSVAITGARGYIGTMLIERLVEREEIDRIVAIDVLPFEPIGGKIESAEADIRDPKIARVIEGCDTVVHLAFVVTAINDLGATYSINLGGSRNLLSACEDAGIEKLVAASSLAAYGIQPRDNRPIDEDRPLRGSSESYYLHTKRLVEEDLDVFEKRNPDVLVTRLRPSILIGPRNYNFAHEAGRTPVEIKVREGAYLPVVHEDDAVRAFELAVIKDVPGAFNITFDEPLELSEFMGGKGGRQLMLSIGQLLWISKLGYGLRLTKLSPDWIHAARGNWRADTSRARELLGWEPEYDLDTTLDQMRGNIESSGFLGRKAGQT